LFHLFQQVRDFRAQTLAEVERNGFQMVDDWGTSSKGGSGAKTPQKEGAVRGRERIVHGSV
jgi:hypothetical protein